MGKEYSLLYSYSMGRERGPYDLVLVLDYVQVSLSKFWLKTSVAAKVVYLSLVRSGLFTLLASLAPFQLSLAVDLSKSPPIQPLARASILNTSTVGSPLLLSQQVPRQAAGSHFYVHVTKVGFEV